MLAYRIATEAKDYKADDLTGNGAKKDGGRWNKSGSAMLYTSPSIALAMLETVVHIGSSGLPLNRYLVEIDIPGKVWAARGAIDNQTAPVGWDALPTGLTSIEYGDKWLKSMASALLLVPSVIVPEEENILINPLHADASVITARKIRRWQYDHRFWS